MSKTMGTIPKLLMAQTLLTSNNEETTAPGSAEPDDVKQKQKKALPGANGANDNVMGTKKNGHTPVRENTKVANSDARVTIYFQQAETYETVRGP